MKVCRFLKLFLFIVCTTNGLEKARKLVENKLQRVLHHFNGKLAVSKTRILPIFTLSCFLQSSFQYKVCIHLDVGIILFEAASFLQTLVCLFIHKFLGWNHLQMKLTNELRFYLPNKTKHATYQQSLF